MLLCLNTLNNTLDYILCATGTGISMYTTRHHSGTGRHSFLRYAETQPESVNQLLKLRESGILLLIFNLNMSIEKHNHCCTIFMYNKF